MMTLLQFEGFVQAVAAMGGFLLSVLIYFRTQNIGKAQLELHHLVNSTAQELLAATKEGAYSEGKAAGRLENMPKATP